MGFSDQERRNIDTKVLQASVFDANSTGVWFESRLASGKMIDSRQVLAEVDKLESNPAANVTDARNNASGPLNGIIADLSQPASAVRLTPVPGTNGSTYVALETYGDWTSNRIKNWIQPQMIPLASGAASIGYAVRLYNGDPAGSGVEVLTTDGTTGVGVNKSVGWIFNYDNGELILSDDFKNSVPDPYVMGFYYIGEVGGAGGGQSCEHVYSMEIPGSNLAQDSAGNRYFKTRMPMFRNGPFTKVYENGTLLVAGTDWEWGAVRMGLVPDLIDNVRIVNPHTSSTYRLEYTECRSSFAPRLALYRRDSEPSPHKSITPRVNIHDGVNTYSRIINRFTYADPGELVYYVEYIDATGAPSSKSIICKTFANHIRIAGIDENWAMSPWRIELWKTGARKAGGNNNRPGGYNTALVPYAAFATNRIKINPEPMHKQGTDYKIMLRNTNTNEVTLFADRDLSILRKNVWQYGNNGDKHIGVYYMPKLH